MEQLGINLVNVVIYMMLFAVLFLILHKFLLSKLFVALEKRQLEIRKGIEASHKAQSTLDEADKKALVKLDNVEKERREQIDIAKKAGRKEAEEIVAAARAEAKTIIDSAKEKEKAEFKKLEADFDERVKAKATEIVEKAIGKNPQVQKELISKAINEL